MNLGPDVPGGSAQSHPLYPQGPLSETREEEAQAKARSRVRLPRLLEDPDLAFLLGKDRPLPWQGIPSLLHSLQELPT